ncbi:hypothetical protein WKI68_05295 [Streptomyces sp. MS1.HAVA.3]|uniref:Uncharacterized protein n=1 Tax=Streptomyces caledonius TaxID=3134107 RepID=A0ABU8U131_9ACTN
MNKTEPGPAATGTPTGRTTSADELVRLDALSRSLPGAGGQRTYWMKITPTRVTGRRVVNR